jgi:hypothetical protein
VDTQATLQRLAVWAESLEAKGLVTLTSYRLKTPSSWSLVPKLKSHDAGLVTVFNFSGKPVLALYRSVFERRALASIEPIEKILGFPLGQGNQISDNFSDELLDALTQAHVGAASNRT